MNNQAEDILLYWFGERVDGWTTTDREKLWFAARPADDREMQEKFAPLIDCALNGDLEQWRQSPDGLIAYIILLDQMTRVIKRGSVAAFTGDPQALAACKEGILSGMDQKIAPAYCRFFYLPLEHSENLADQEQCVALFEAAGQRFPQHKAAFVGSYDYAVVHLKIIQEFGRFPHRNDLFGRKSTAAEIKYLEDNPNAYFGQKK